MASLVTNDTTTTTTPATRRRTTAATETAEQMTDNEVSHFEDLPGILQICIGTATKPGLIAYFDDDILAMINMFAKTCKKFLEYDPLRCYYFRVVLTKKYGVNLDDNIKISREMKIKKDCMILFYTPCKKRKQRKREEKKNKKICFLLYVYLKNTSVRIFFITTPYNFVRSVRTRFTHIIY